MKNTSVSKYINSLSQEELQKEILMLLKKIPAVKEYYKMELGSVKEREQLYKKVKLEITKRYATKSYRKPRKPRIQKINKLLTEMKKKSIFDHELVDLYLFDIETCIRFSIEYGVVTIVMQNHIDQVYEKADALIQESKLEDMFEERTNWIKDNRQLF